ncbi:hypothetical protein Clocel_2958 [Clostridium cellulovorans 743B]|uniref:Uncharacterized protein n=1 Tax=Clostridium cellulovorans (strain ATCC 35296 / DSM 3052 / OCM 3 / 743B) TaxID=573061 RepID=D9SSY8_CLOC7|nr:hypothetical protein Clocel_2958 [Clostridium cellulovorans 743B]
MKKGDNEGRKSFSFYLTLLNKFDIINLDIFESRCNYGFASKNFYRNC